MKRLICLVTLLLSLASLFAAGAQAQVKASVDRQSVGEDETVDLIISVSGPDAKKIPAPVLPKMDFIYLSMSSSSSSSVSIVNGSYSSQSTVSYIYTLTPKKTGRLIIPPVQLKYRNQVWTTNPLSVSVTKGSSKGRASSRSYRQTDELLADTNPRGNTLVIAVPEKKLVYKGEPVAVRYYLYTQENLAKLSFGEEKDYPGYGKEQAYEAQNITFDPVKYNGHNYNRMLIKTLMLTPNMAQTISVPSVSMVVDVGVSDLGLFGFGSAKRKIIGNPITKIAVKDLPESDRPNDFSGAIGTFKLSAQLKKDHLSTGEAADLIVNIDGYGNFNQFSPPTPPSMNKARFMSPEITNPDTNGKGRKSIRYPVLAQSVGSDVIPPLRFTFFNTNTGKYETLETPSFTLTIAQGSAEPGSDDLATGKKQEQSDIIEKAPMALTHQYHLLYQSYLYWAVLLIALLLLPFVLLYRKELNLQDDNYQYRLSKHAGKHLQQWLSTAQKQAIAQDSNFYQSAQNAIRQFLFDKWQAPKGLSLLELRPFLEEKQLPAALIQETLDFLSLCDQARFTPGQASVYQLQEHNKQLSQLMQSWLKEGKVS